MVPLGVTTEVTFNNTDYYSHFLHMEWGSEKPNSLAAQPESSGARADTRPLALNRGNNSSLRRGMRMLGTASLAPLGNACQKQHLEDCHGSFGNPRKTPGKEK